MNLLVLCTDTFRADYMGCYGSSWVKTPRLDAMAAQGVRLNDFYGEALPTIPVRRVLYTGRKAFPFQYMHQRSDSVQLPGWHPLFEEDVTLAETLREQGYATGLISDVYHMMKPGKNFHRGFDSWRWVRGQENDRVVPIRSAHVDPTPFMPENTPSDSWGRVVAAQYLSNRAWWQGEADHYAAQVMQAASEWVTDYGSDRPWMLWVESFDPHEPWDAPEEYVDMYCPDYKGRDLLWAPGTVDDLKPEEFERIRAQYAGEHTHVDRWCGHVLDTLESLSLLEDTVVVFTSDHGAMMGEQGQIHKGESRLRTQVTRSPLIVRHPDTSYAGTVVDGLVQHQDLMPTLLGVLGAETPERCDGESFWPLVTGERTGGLRDVAISAFGAYAGVRTNDWNYQTPWAKEGPQSSSKPELYDRRTDPDELHDVAADHPEVVRELQGHLDEVLAGRPASGTVAITETPAAIPGLKL